MPVVRIEHLSEAQKRAYLVADNQLALRAGRSEGLLAAELAWLRDESFDLDLVGFDATELERLLAIADRKAGSRCRGRGPGAARGAGQQAGRPLGARQPPPVVRRRHGAGRRGAGARRPARGHDPCDPPYNVDYANTPKDKLRGKHRPILNDNLGGGFEAFLLDACANILAVTKGAGYVCMSSSELHTLQM